MIEAIIGLVSAVFGFIGGLFVPWVKWIIDKKRNKYNTRKEMISECRSGIAGIKIKGCGGLKHFMESPAYSQLRVHMNSDVIKKVEAQRTSYVGGGRGDDVLTHMLLDEVSRLEKKWKLV